MLLRLLELIRFSHTLFALPFALLAAAMAWAANLRARPPVRVSLAGLAGHPGLHGRSPAARRWPSIGWPTGGSTR